MGPVASTASDEGRLRLFWSHCPIFFSRWSPRFARGHKILWAIPGMYSVVVLGIAIFYLRQDTAPLPAEMTGGPSLGTCPWCPVCGGVGGIRGGSLVGDDGEKRYGMKGMAGGEVLAKG